MDIRAKIFSSILTQRLNILIKKYGIRYQFGSTPGVGCQDGIFTLRTVLHTRHNHNLPSYVAFIDLVKAFDTANHKLLFALLAKFGAPPKFVHAIEHMYRNIRIILKIGKAKSQFQQEVGMHQGDCLAPLLFGTFMIAFGLLYEQARNDSSMSKMHFCRSSNSPRDNRQLISDKSSDKGIQFKVPLLLYIDDSALIFSSRGDLETGINIAFTIFKLLSLEMHIRYEGVKSKTECVFFPLPCFFHKQVIQGDTKSESEDVCIIPKRESNKSKVKRENEMYDNLPETKPVKVANRVITFSQFFKYLASIFSYNL